jgi:hypothetical protein
MAKPITWRTIAGPSFNNSALATAVGAFDRAGSGFGEVSDRLMETQDRVDQQYTNQAVKQALQTGYVDANLNPRADSTAVYEALLGKRKADSDILTAQQDRTESRATVANLQEETAAQAYLNTPEMREFDRQIKQAQMERARAQTETEKTNADLRLQELNFLRDQEGRKIEISKGTDFINDEVEALTGEFANEIMRKEFGLDEQGRSSDPNFVPPTESEINEIWEQARARAEGREGRRIIQGRYDGPTEGWTNSIFGKLDARAEAVEDATTTRRIEEEDRLRREGRLSATYQEAGDFSRSVWRDNDVVPEEDEDRLAAETLSSDREAIARLRTAGLKTNYSADEKEVLGEVRDLFPTSSMFTQIVKSFTVDGKLDEDGLRKAAQEGARALLLATQRRSNAPEIILTDADNPRTQVGRPRRTAADIVSGQQDRRPNRRIRGGPNRGSQ